MRPQIGTFNATTDLFEQSGIEFEKLCQLRLLGQAADSKSDFRFCIDGLAMHSNLPFGNLLDVERTIPLEQSFRVPGSCQILQVDY